MVVRLFTDAEKYLERKSALGRAYKPGLIVLLVAISFSLQPIGVYFALDSTEAAWISDLLTVLWVGYFMWGLALWGIFTIALYLLSSLAGGKPLLGHLTRTVGWGMLPMICSGVVWTAGKYLTYRDYSLSEPPYPGIEHENAVFNEFTAQTAGDPLLVGAVGLGCCFVALSGYLWAAGLITASDISRRKATAIAGITVGVYVGWKLLAVV